MQPCENLQGPPEVRTQSASPKPSPTPTSPIPEGLNVLSRLKLQESLDQMRGQHFLPKQVFSHKS